MRILDGFALYFGLNGYHGYHGGHGGHGGHAGRHGDRDQQQEHVARLDRHVVRLERADVRRAGRVDAAVGREVADEREHADAAVLDLGLCVRGEKKTKGSVSAKANN